MLGIARTRKSQLDMKGTMTWNMCIGNNLYPDTAIGTNLSRIWEVGDPLFVEAISKIGH